MSEEHEYAKGCLGEAYPWLIVKDYVTTYCDETACHHCTPVEGKEKGWWRCPWAVVAFNQGHYDSTVVCLLCILENAGKLGVKL